MPERKSNSFNKQKSYYKGEFKDGLFDGKGEAEIFLRKDCFIDMPLICEDVWKFKYLKLSDSTTFKAGKLGNYCNLYLDYKSSSLSGYAPSNSIRSYIGELCNGVFDGKGKLEYMDCDTYEG
jgi:MORN repeat